MTQNGAAGVNEVEKLLVVQEYDLKAAGMERELRDIPARKKEETSRLNQHRQALADLEQALKGLQADAKKIELDAAALREKIAKFRQQQLELKTNREFKAVETEIKAVEDEIARVEDRQIEVMEAIERNRVDRAARAAALQEEEGAVAQDVQQLGVRAAAVEASLKDCQGSRAAAAQGVDPQWLAAYDRIFHRKGKALVALADGVCSGCHMRVPPAVVHAARKRNAIIYCDSCGRLLY
jgi:uncharacterized protein